MTDTAAAFPPAGFVAPPQPPLARPDQVVSHVERTVFDRPLELVAARVDATPLSVRHPAAAGVPGVVASAALTPEAFGPEGSRHLLALSDGGTVVEQVIENRRTPDAWRFRYQVWGYTTPAARPIRYGLGDFHYLAAGPRTEVVWTYSFQLRPDAFPGFLGPKIGGALLKLAYLNGAYATWMRAGLAAIKAAVEAD